MYSASRSPTPSSQAPSGESTRHDGPLISVIMPVYNGGEDLVRALTSLRASDFDDYELILVDDASTDDTAEVLARFAPDVLIRMSRNVGPFRCRNLAGRHARGQLLFFTDADVTVQPDTLSRLARHWLDHRRRCVIGLYTQHHPNEGLFSRYKNAWIRYTYLMAPPEVGWFFTAVGMVHRDLFTASGGFDPDQLNDSLADVQFGRQLAARGVGITKDDALEVTHWKAFTLRGLLRNQLSRAYGALRVAGLSELGRVALQGYGNVTRGFIASTLLAPLWLFLALLTPAAAVLSPAPGLFATGLVLVSGLYALLNGGFWGHALVHYGVRDALGFAALGFLDHLACALGLGRGLLSLFAEREGLAGPRGPQVAFTVREREHLP